MRKTILLTSLLLIVFLQNQTLSQNSIFAKNNFRIYPSNTTQSEVLVVTHPFNSKIIFASANAIQYMTGFFVSEGIYVSTDGGKNWSGTDTCNGQVIQYHGGDPAITIDKDGRFILTHLGRIPFYGMYSHYSTDLGKNWSYQNLISTNNLERASLASDNNITSNKFGNTYCSWVELIPPYPVMFSKTTDAAVSWSTPINVNNPTSRCAGGELAIDENSNIHLVWAVVINTSPYYEIAAGYAKSTDGGTNWQVKENAIILRGVQGLLESKSNIRINGYPKIDIDKSNSPYKGTIYIITTQKFNSPAGNDPDIVLYKSTDNGTTFSQGIRVNQDQINNGKSQFFPALHVDNGGGVNIIYYDDRLTTNDSASVFLSRSTDGGNTFIDYIISDHNFKPAPLSGFGQGYQGDNIGLTSSGNTLIPVWMDNSSGIYQIWTNLVDLTLLKNDEAGKTINNFSYKLLQNYPNPFNPETEIKYSIKYSGQVTLKIYDMLGKELQTPVNEFLQPGSYSFKFNGKDLTSGIYFYELKAGEFREIKKMILLK